MASLAVFAEGALFEAAAGVVSVRTGVEVTPDTVFQIGSITKTFTSTQVMQLVDEGRLDLDVPVFDRLPELPECVPVQRVQRLRPVHADGCDVIGDLQLDVLEFSHASSPASQVYV